MTTHASYFRLFLVICLSGMGTTLAQANPFNDGPNMRDWQFASGKTSFTGAMVSHDASHITLRLRNDRLVTMPLVRLSDSDQDWVRNHDKQRKQPTLSTIKFVSSPSNAPTLLERPEAAKHFDPFKKQRVKTQWDREFLYVTCDGIPDHEMMVGITAWQQQIPIPQPYRGTNVWQIPLKPTPASEPYTSENRFRGAMALAVNGVPIFDPIKNDGRTDTNLAGELDDYGGHCGRADDYHYHLPPVHLAKIVGEDKPIAYALDGYPIYSYQSAEEEENQPKLDIHNGHKDKNGNYHYHATLKFPYLNGGFYGKVQYRNGQVEPQPRSFPIRPATSPLRDAKITGFERSKDGKQVSVEYKVQGEKRTVGYTTSDFQSFRFKFESGGDPSFQTYELNTDVGGQGGNRRNRDRR